MKADVVAKRYARALYELGREEGLQEKFLSDMENIVAIIRDSDEFRSTMESPLYDILLKKRILGELVTKINLTNYTANFLTSFSKRTGSCTWSPYSIPTARPSMSLRKGSGKCHQRHGTGQGTDCAHLEHTQADREKGSGP